MENLGSNTRRTKFEGVDIASQIAEFATAISTQPDRKSAAQHVVRGAQRLVGCAGVMMVRLNDAPQLQVVASTDPDLMATAVGRVSESEETLSGRVLRQHEPELNNNLAQDKRRTAATHRFDNKVGIRSALSLPMRSVEIDFGALTFYDDQVDYFTPDLCSAAQAYSDVATLALARVVDHVQAQNLEVALDSNREIGMAIGILMSLYKTTQDAAFAILRTASQNGHRKLRDVATDVIMTGEVPLTRASRATSEAP